MRPRPVRAGASAARLGRRRDEAGFTLAELLVAVVVFGLVAAPISASLIVGLRSTADSHQRFTDARAAQTAAAFFANDVQSAQLVTPGDPSPCGGGADAVVSFGWSDDRAADNVVSYRVRASGPDRQLVRTACVEGTGPVDVVVAHDLAPRDPEIACSPSCAEPRALTLHVVGRSGAEFTLHGTRRSS